MSYDTILLLSKL